MALLSKSPDFAHNFLNLCETNLFFTEYLTILVIVCFSIFLSVLILILSYLLSVQNPETEKLSSYECGFEPYDEARKVLKRLREFDHPTAVFSNASPNMLEKALMASDLKKWLN